MACIIRLVQGDERGLTATDKSYPTKREALNALAPLGKRIIGIQRIPNPGGRTYSVRIKSA